MTPAVLAAIPFVIRQDYTLLQAAQAAKLSGLSMLQSAPYLYLAYPATSANDMANVLTQVWIDQASRASIAEALASCKKSDGSPAYTQQEISAVTQYGYPSIERFEIKCVDTPARCSSQAFDAEICWFVVGAQSATLTDMTTGQVVQQQVYGNYGIIVNTLQPYWWRLSAPGIKPVTQDLRNDM